MDVAEALLDDSRRLSSSDITTSSNSSCGWNSSNSELNDKSGDLPSKDSLFGSWTKRPRAMSESEGGNVKMNLVGWLTGYTAGYDNNKLNTPPFKSTRVRRSSSRDVEEAMAGGLSKADLYMPPM